MRHALMFGAVIFCGCGTPGVGPGLDSGSGADAGVDAGPASDAGADAGGRDAAVVDAGLSDAGVLDAGRPDAGATDAGAADAGMDAGADAGGASDAGLHTGALVGGSGTWPGAISGVHFRSGTQSGFTDDAGSFSWQDGAPITFSVGDVDFRATAGKRRLSAWQLANPGTCTQSLEFERVLVLFAGLDVDGDPATGTALQAVPPSATQRAFSSLTDADLAALIAQKFPGRLPVPALDAVDRFIRQVDGELWAEKSFETFGTAASAARSQGVTSNGTAWFFSWRLGLERTDLSFNTTKSNTLAIPLALGLAGSNHIGDIDLNGNTLWVPIEDGSAYQHPYLVEYDATTLTAGTQHLLSNTMLTKGVPWVAVDGPRAALYVAEWDPTPQLFVLSLATAAYSKALAIRPTLGRIQGGKVFEGSLYASLDDTAKSIFKINLDTGTAQSLFTVSGALGGEEEGLAFLARPDGTLLHTQNANPSATAMEFHHHQRTRDPLRLLLCP